MRTECDGVLPDGSGAIGAAPGSKVNGGGSAASVPQLPEKVMMALVSTPAMFAVPTSINKGFNPPFVLRVGVVSTAPTQIKATVAAYVLQKDQVCILMPPHVTSTHQLINSIIIESV